MVAPPIPEAKKRERARLSDLFERLSARQPLRTTDASTLDFSRNNNQTTAPPEELSSVLRNLSVIRKYDVSQARHSRTRRNTVASPWEISGVSSKDAAPSQKNDQDNRALHDFPLVEGAKYPFTFKYMIHKLYKQDDWLRTVKEVLEKSKKNFKPLAESDMTQNPSACIDPHGNRMKFTEGPPHYVEKRTTTSGVTKRKAVRRMSLADRYRTKPPYRLNSSHFLPVDVEESPAESGRTLKKRCVGIRKSISGNPEDERNSSIDIREPNKGGTIVFASTISSTECPGEEIYLHFPSPQASPSVSCFSDEGNGTASPGSPLFPITPTSPISPYAMGFVAGLKRRVSVNHPVVVLNAPPTGQLTERNCRRDFQTRI